MRKFTKNELVQIDYIKGLNVDSYDRVGTYDVNCRYNGVDAMLEVLRGIYMLSLSDMPQMFKAGNVMLFASKETLLSSYMCIQNGNNIELYDMKMSAFNAFEQFMRNN